MEWKETQIFFCLFNLFFCDLSHFSSSYLISNLSNMIQQTCRKTLKA